MPSIWQIVWLIVTNIPTLIKFIREMKDAFDGDHKEVKHALKVLAAAVPENKLAVVDNNGALQLVRQIRKPEVV